MKNNVITIVLVAALLGVVIVEEIRISDLKESLATKGPDQAPVGVKDRRAVSSGSSLGDRNASVSRRVKSGERESETPLEGFGKAMRKMADSPAAKAMFAQGHMSTAAAIYGPFIESLNLRAEEEKYFLGLLAGEFTDQQQLGMKMMGAANAEERTALAEEMEANKEARKKEISDFLNDKEDQESFEDYHDRLAEHQQMPGIRAAIASTGNDLRPKQETALVDVMHKIRTSGEGAKKWEGAQAMETMAQGNVVEIFEEDWAKGQKAYQEELQGALDDDQMEAFFDSQAQMKEFNLMGIKMMQNMMKDKK